MANFVYIATSMDGYIAAKDGGIQWLNDIPNPEKSDYGYGKFISQIDAILLGRGTFEKVMEFDFWPYEKPVFVFSNSIKALPESYAGKCQLVAGNPEQVLQQLHSQNFHNIYIDGGKTIQSFLAADLVDELIISTIPILLGEGIPLFGKMDNQLNFVLKESCSFANGVVKNHYTRKKNDQD